MSRGKWAMAGMLCVLLALLGGGLWRSLHAPRPRYGVHLLTAGPRSLELARAAGVDTVVQLFAWRDIEPTQGQYHWQVPDEIVQGAAYYGLRLVVRLDQQPRWASRASQSLNAPPDDPADFTRFAGMVAGRYRGRVAAYVIWNEPNLASDWGGRAPDPAAYAAMLRGAYQAIKAGDPQALVVSAGLASTNENSQRAVDDRTYLEGVYLAGAAPYFDVLGSHPYGFAYPPDDPHGAHEGLNMARLEDLRAIMARNGDARKPVWATEMGWTTRGTGTAAWQTVSPQQQAAYLSQALRAAPRAWPWLTLLAVWNLDGGGDPNWAGYSLLGPDDQPGPAYRALAALLAPSRLPQVAAGLAQSSQGLLRAGLALWPGRAAQPYTVLATDTVIHLGDSEYSEPWMPLYANRNPSTEWQGVFYLPDAAARRAAGDTWRLHASVMQSNAWGNYVWLNGQRLEPPLPLGDYTNSWMAVSLDVPASVLHAGPNHVRVDIGRAVPLLQDQGFAWDDLQIKDVFLTAGSTS